MYLRDIVTHNVITGEVVDANTVGKKLSNAYSPFVLKCTLDNALYNAQLAFKCSIRQIHILSQMLLLMYPYN